MTFTSAWAVGSLSGTTVLPEEAMILPSFTMTAPKGPPLWFFTFSTARRMASRINRGLYELSLMFLGVFSRLLMTSFISLNSCLS